MKKLIASIIILLIATTISYAQIDTVSNTILHTLENKKEVVVSKEVSVTSKMSAKVLRLSRKRNNEIISIKSYRKSLNIKMKTVKIC